VPDWRTSSRVWAAWSRRHNLNAPAQEILTGILPVAEVDKHWDNERLDLWGIFMQQVGTATPNRLGAATLLAGQLEVLVHKVEVQLAITGATAGQIAPVHLFTPLQAYLPTAINVALVLPWLQTMVRPQDPGRLSRAVGLIGETDAGLMVVTVNGAPHVAVGPSYSINTYAAGMAGGRRHVIWGFQDPPLRVKPFEQLTVQTLVQIPTSVAIQVNMFYTEREFQGDVG
jgi:hypothetical protein